MSKIIILGPPCVGKTTLAYLALKHKIPSFSTHQSFHVVDYEIEDFQVSIAIHNREEFFIDIINLDISLFLDAGGVDINYINQYKNKGFGIRTVLLLPPKDVYLERERMEIESKGEHRNQDGLTQYNKFKEQKSEYDLIIEDVLSSQEIFNYIKEWNEK
jgi:guanylate kinase